MQDLFLWEDNELKRKNIAVRVVASTMAAVMSLSTASGAFCMNAYAAEEGSENTTGEMAEDQTEAQAEEVPSGTDSQEILVETVGSDTETLDENVSVKLPSSDASAEAEDTTDTTVTTDNEDGTKTTVTTTTKTEYAPGTSATSSISEGDADYKKLVDDNGDPVLDENGNEQWSYEKVETTGGSTKTTTTTRTTVTKETTETNTSLTNAASYEDKAVYNVAPDGSKEKASDDEAGKVKDFLSSLNVTSDFVVYANALTGTCGHEDGNIAAGELYKSTTVMNKEQYGSDEINKDYALDGYSYIGSAPDGVSVTTSSNQKEGDEMPTLVTGNGSNVTVNVTEESGTANHFDRVQLGPESFDDNDLLKEDALKAVTTIHPELEDLGDVMKIGSNLSEIARTGEAITSAYETAGLRTSDEDTAAIKAAAVLLDETDESGEKILGSGDIISLTVGINTLTSAENDNDYNNGKYLTQLINKNTNGVDIVINVLIGDGADEGASVTINKIMNDINNYDSRAAYLVWNFGDYKGTINITGTFSGVIVAPNAQVDLGEIQSGRIVADKVSHTAEVHMAVKGTYETTVKTTSEILSDETESQSNTINEESYLIYHYKGVSIPVIPVKPDEPEVPEVPVTPEAPMIPDTPVTPEVPVDPDVPQEVTVTPPYEDHYVPANGVKTNVPVLPDDTAYKDVTETNAALGYGAADRNVSTGDESDLALYGSMAFAGAAGLFMWLILFLKRKKH